MELVELAMVDECSLESSRKLGEGKEEASEENGEQGRKKDSSVHLYA